MPHNEVQRISNKGYSPDYLEESTSRIKPNQKHQIASNQGTTNNKEGTSSKGVGERRRDMDVRAR